MISLTLYEMSILKKSEFETQSSISRDVMSDIFQRLLLDGVFRRVEERSDRVRRSAYAEEVVVSVRFVGVIFYRNVFMLFLPKYLAVEKDFEGDARREAQLISDVLRKVQRESVRKSEYSPDIIESDSSLALALQIIEHFEKFGLYTDMKRTTTLNGSGAIDWRETISFEPPHIFDGSPVHINVRTRQIEIYRHSLISRLHSAVLGFCAKLLNESGMAFFLDICFEYDSHENLDEFSDVELIIREIEKESRVQFVTWKADILELMASFLREIYGSRASEGLYYFGTQSFNLVWEIACKTVFGDKSQHQLSVINSELGFPGPQKGSDRLSDVIPRPLWSNVDETIVSPGGSLVPDIISFYEDPSHGKGMCILDAKYYTPTFESAASGVPGLESITKQFLYQRSYQEFIVENNFSWLKNVFLFPNDSNQSMYFGRVSFPGLFDEVPPLSQFIDAIYVPAHVVFSAYLRDQILLKELLFSAPVNLLSIESGGGSNVREA